MSGPELGSTTDFGISNICMLAKVNCENQRKLTAEISGSEQVDEFAYNNMSGSAGKCATQFLFTICKHAPMCKFFTSEDKLEKLALLTIEL